MQPAALHTGKWLVTGGVWGASGGSPGVLGIWGVTAAGPGRSGEGLLGCPGMLTMVGSYWGAQKVQFPVGSGAAAGVTGCVVVVGPAGWFPETDGTGSDTVPPDTVGSITVWSGTTDPEIVEDETPPPDTGAAGSLGPATVPGSPDEPIGSLSSMLGRSIPGSPIWGSLQDMRSFPALRLQYASSLPWHACTGMTQLTAMDPAIWGRQPNKVRISSKGPSAEVCLLPKCHYLYRTARSMGKNARQMRNTVAERAGALSALEKIWKRWGMHTHHHSSALGGGGAGTGFGDTLLCTHIEYTVMWLILSMQPPPYMQALQWR